MNESNDQPDVNWPERSVLLRDILVLQLKLVVDGLRDFLLVPVSLVIGLGSLIRGGPEAGSGFYELLRAGRRSERWINLFGAADRVYGPSFADNIFPTENIDEIVGKVENFVVEEYARGGVTRQAKDQIDRALDSLQKLAEKQRSASREKREDDT